MIANPHLPAFRYDPYSRTLTSESYDVSGMMGARSSSIAEAATAVRWGVILGTLGRQGNTSLLGRVEAALDAAGRSHFVLLLSEVTPARLRAFPDVQAWVQIACPRLSVDWGGGFDAPLLTPYELEVRVEGGGGGVRNAARAPHRRRTNQQSFFLTLGGVSPPPRI